MSIHYFNKQKKTNIIKKKIIHVALKNNNQKNHPRHRKRQGGWFALASSTSVSC